MSNLQSINNDWFSAVIKGNTNKVKRLISEGAEVNAVDEYNNTPLHYAATNGDAEIVKDLLDNEADVNAVGQDEKTPLHWAAAHGHKEVVEALLKVKGIDVNAQDKDGKTPLHWATVYDNKQVVEALLDKGANVNAEDEDGNIPLNLTIKNTSLDLATNQDIETLLRNTAKLLKVAKSGDIQEVNSLINKGANVNATDQDGKTPLHLAAEKDHKEVVEALLDKGANVNVVDKDGNTPLKLAPKGDIRTLLIDTALLEAVKNGEIDKVKSLISEGADVNAVDGNEKTPLHWAATHNHKEVVEALLDKGANVNAVDKDGKTPLKLAPKGDIRTLLIDTALLEAVKNGEIDKVKSLISEGADVNAYDRSQGNSLYWAVKNDYSDIAKVLLDNGANFFAYDSSRERHVLNKYEEVQAEHCKVSLHLAARLGNLKEVENLLREGADVNVKNDKGETPLHFAAEMGHAEIVKDLLDKGASVNITDRNGKTPLHWAAKKGHQEAVKDLLDKGANVNVVDKDGNTPLKLANDDKIKILLQPAEKSDDVNPVDESSTNNEKNSEEDAGVNPEHPAPVELSTPTQNNGGQITTTSTEEEIQTSNNSTISIKEKGKIYDKSEYFSGSTILDQDNLNPSLINFHCSLNEGEKMQLDKNIHQVRTIFSEYNDNDIRTMWIGVFDIGKLDTDEFKKREIKASEEKHWKNSIHVKFGDVQDKVLVYSWLDTNQFSQDKWNNLLSELEKDHKVDFIGTGPLTLKYKGFDYRVYPPLFGSSDDEKSFLNDTEVFSFSRTEVNQIIEDIKESHQSIKKKIASYYESLGKDFAENNKGYIEIKAGIDKNNVKNFTDVSYTNKPDNIDNTSIKEAFIKEEERNNVGNSLHLAVYTNSKDLMERALDVTDVNEVNKNDRTPLHLAAKYGREAMATMLLDKGAGVDVVDSRGRTPLHLAAKYGRGAMVEMLLNKGAKVDVVDSRGRTPLHWAVQNNNKEIVDALIKAKANVNIKDEDGNTPLGLTTNEEIITLLQPAKKSDDGSVGEPATDSEGVQEEDAGTQQKEKQEGNAQPGSDIIGQDSDTQSDNSKEEEEKTNTISAEKGTDIKAEGVKAVAPIEPAQTEEQPSSFFGSLFSILMKPFSLIASFFGGFFSWLFGSDTDESTSQTDANVSLLKPDSLDEKKIDAQPGHHSSLAPN